VIRPFAEEDAPAVAALLHEDDPPWPVTAAGVLHWQNSRPERARGASWIALEADEVAGWAEAKLLWTTSAEGVGEPWAFVRPSCRGRGYGGKLWEAAVEHLAAEGARVLETWAENDAGRAFLERRGWRPGGGERLSLLDLAYADLSLLPALEQAKANDGFRLVPLGDVLDRPGELHALDAAATADIPATFVENDVRYNEWARSVLEHPQLSLDGSFVVLGDDRAVAFTLLEVDPDHGLASNEMTGTLPEFRRRGLARLAKLATIRWAREQGYRTILTSNDEQNSAMVRLNESLGYHPVGRKTEYLLELE
jgi:GNAT superfamily N-acetyltransferase